MCQITHSPAFLGDPAVLEVVIPLTEFERLHAEIERLQKQNEELLRHDEEVADLTLTQHVEIERLRATIERLLQLRARGI